MTATPNTSALEALVQFGRSLDERGGDVTPAEYSQLADLAYDADDYGLAHKYEALQQTALAAANCEAINARRAELAALGFNVIALQNAAVEYRNKLAAAIPR